MRVVDANVLLYAVNADAEHHNASREWLDRSLSGADSIGFGWVVMLAFIRISTKVGLFPSPISSVQASRQVGDWLAAPGAHLLSPGRAHLPILERLLTVSGSAGNLVLVAHLAALAIEHRAAIVSYDTDFGRFQEITCSRPVDLL